MLVGVRLYPITGRTNQRQDYDERSTHDQHENHIDTSGMSPNTAEGAPYHSGRSARNSLLWSRLRIPGEAS